MAIPVSSSVHSSSHRSRFTAGNAKWLVQIPDEKENILKQGDWNTLRIRVEGAHVQTWLNGELMADLTDKKIGATQGRIALQIHDGGGIKVQWRNIRLTRL